jgi:hypothetical protein
MMVGEGDTLFAYVYLDPLSRPREIMLTWLAYDWEHRACWGENVITEGVDGTAARRHMGPLPPSGRWVRLEVPANDNRNGESHSDGNGIETIPRRGHVGSGGEVAEVNFESCATGIESYKSP